MLRYDRELLTALPGEEITDSLEEYNLSSRWERGNWDNLKPISLERALQIQRNVPGISFNFLQETDREPLKAWMSADTGVIYQGASI